MEKNKAFVAFFVSVTLFLLWTLLLLSANHTLLPAFFTADKQLFLQINGAHNAFWDTIMYYASGKTFWFPFYAIIIFFLWKSFGKKVWRALVAVVLLILTSDQVGSHLVKNFVQRLRPSHTPELNSLVHLSKAGHGGLYGFVSSHAANTFALMVFLWLLLDKSYRPLKIVLLIWAVLVSYSRIYNGVHYPLDIFCGAILGVLDAFVIYFLYRIVFRRDAIQH